MFCILYVQFTTWFFSFSHRSVTTKTIARLGLHSKPMSNNMFCIGCTVWIVFGFLLSASKERMKGCCICSLVLVPWHSLLLYNVYVPYDNKALQKSLSGKKFNASQILFAYDFSQDVDKFIALYCFNALCVVASPGGCTQWRRLLFEFVTTSPCIESFLLQAEEVCLLEFSVRNKSRFLQRWDANDCIKKRNSLILKRSHLDSPTWKRH